MTLPLAMAGSAVVGAALLLHLFRHHRHEWNLTATFIFAVGWAVNSASVLALWYGSYAMTTDPTTGFPVRTLQTTGTALYGYAIAAGVVGCLLVTLMALSRGAPRWAGTSCRPRGGGNVVSLIALVLCVWLALVDPSLSVGTVFIVAAFAAAVVLKPGRGAWLGAAAFTLSLMVASSVFTLARPFDGARPCLGVSKCGPLDALVQGVTFSENALALAAALGLPFVYLAFEGRWRFAALGYGFVFIWLTGSRTSLFALGALLLVLLLVRPGSEPTPTRRVAARCAIGVGIALSAVVPFTPWVDAESFSLRGHLWEIATAAWADSPWFGYGAGGWGKLYTERGLIEAGAIYSPHNQWLEVTFAGGLVGITLFAWWLITAVRAGRSNIQRTALILVPALVVGITERPWSFGLPDWLTWALLAVCLGQDLGVHEPLVSGARGVGDAGREVRLPGDPLALDGRLGGS